MENGRDANHLGVAEQVGLALRGHRRELGQSQRAYAAARGMSRSQLARMEHDASGMKLGDVADALEGTGYCLAVVPVDATPDMDWDPTDLEARTRDGHRFPANRLVKQSTYGPYWWVYHEMMGTGRKLYLDETHNAGGQPLSDADLEAIFAAWPGPGTRFGPKPRHGLGIPPRPWPDGA